MYLQLNAVQRQEVSLAIHKAKLDATQFEFNTVTSTVVQNYVQRPYDAASGFEFCNAEALVLFDNPQFLFTFERHPINTKFYATYNPQIEGDVGVIVDNWKQLMRVFKQWLVIVSAELRLEQGAAAIKPEFKDYVRKLNFVAIENEIKRAESTCSNDPPAALTAACSMVEAALKAFIADHNVIVPSVKQTVKPLWTSVSKYIFNNEQTSTTEDIHRLVSGLSSVIDGLGALRTHSGSAHGRLANEGGIAKEEALLALHAAQTIIFYIMAKW